jgi:two-component system OmpR family response regulator
VELVDGEQRSANGRVLVIEDESKLAAVLARSLTASGYEVICVGGGVAGLEYAQRRDFKLVLLDLLLPDIDGFAVLQRLLERRPRQRVLIMSALSDVGSKVRCLEFGAVDYLAKPFELAELMARVRRHTRAEEADGERVLERAGVRLDLQRRRVSLAGGERIPLPAREFLLLEYMMRKEGEVCGRAELLDHVWGYSFDPGTNVIDVCVVRLRHKIGHDAIETVRNVGYCFVGA